MIRTYRKVDLSQWRATDSRGIVPRTISAFRCSISFLCKLYNKELIVKPYTSIMIIRYNQTTSRLVSVRVSLIESGKGGGAYGEGQTPIVADPVTELSKLSAHVCL